MPQRQAQHQGVFSAQLWKAVGLQQKMLNIPRVHFFSDDFASASSSGPSCSREIEERHGAASTQFDYVPFQDVHKRPRRRASGTFSVYFQDYVEYVTPDSEGPDYEAIVHAPRRARTDSKRKPTSDAYRLAAAFVEPEVEDASASAGSIHREDSAPQEVQAAQMEVEGSPVASAPSAAEAGPGPASPHTQSRPSSPAALSCQAMQCSEEPTPVVVAGKQQPSPEECCAAPPGPATHSTESSQGVYRDMPSPQHDLGSGESSKQQLQASWALSSPLSEDVF